MAPVRVSRPLRPAVAACRVLVVYFRYPSNGTKFARCTERWRARGVPIPRITQRL